MAQLPQSGCQNVTSSLRMHLSPTLLASLAPIAHQLVQSTTDVAQPIGAGFLDALRSLSGKLPPVQQPTSQPETLGSQNESLDTFLNRLRDWFRSSGATGELDVKFTVDQFDEVSTEAYGETADQINQSLAANPQFLQRLREIVIDHRLRASTIVGSNVQAIGAREQRTGSTRSTVEIHMTDASATIQWR